MSPDYLSGLICVQAVFKGSSNNYIIIRMNFGYHVNSDKYCRRAYVIFELSEKYLICIINRHVQTLYTNKRTDVMST